MGNIRRSTLIGLAVVLLAPAGIAGAADLPPYGGSYKDVPVVPAPVPVYESAKYLRGYVGMSNQRVDTFINQDLLNAPSFSIIDKDFDSAPILGIGIGYIANEWVRFDVTGEYRGKSSFRGLDTYVDQTDVNGDGFFDVCPTGVCTNEHTGFKSEWLFLANAYLDLGTYKGVTPYVGAGLGTARITLHDFWDVNLVTNGLWWARDESEWNFAWALHAGLAYDVTESVTFDIGYRYVNMGDAKTGGYSTYDPTQPTNINPTTLKDIDSHDLMVGLRMKFGHGGHHAPATYKY